MNAIVKSSPEIVHVSVRGHTIDAVQRDGRVHVVIKRACEELGIDVENQRKKLKAARWAVTVMITATGPDGKNYDMECVDLDSLPMWLASINPSKVRPELRPTLELFQCEAARVLRDHFFGRREQPSHVEALVRDLAATVSGLAIAVAEMRGKPIEAQTRIGESKANSIKSRLRWIGVQLHRALPHKSAASWRNNRDQRVRKIVEFPKSRGGGWESLPSSRYDAVDDALRVIEEDLADICNPTRQEALPGVASVTPIASAKK